MAEYAQPGVLVDTNWVVEHLKDPKARLVEVDVDTSAYEQGHVPGAVGWNWQSQLQDQVRRDLVDKAGFERLCRESGISNDTTVVLYGDNNNWFAAWAFWQFKYYGFDNITLMNGGRKKWIEEGRELTQEPPKYPESNFTAKEPDRNIRALRGFVEESVNNPARGLVDVRSPAEYTGEVIAPPGMSETAQRGGHIPGAKNIPWSQAVREDGTFKPVEELKALYEGEGLRPDQEVIAYCRIGERSSHTWFVLKYLLGYPKVRNYDGSWTEWGNLIEAPIVKTV